MRQSQHERKRSAWCPLCSTPGSPCSLLGQWSYHGAGVCIHSPATSQAPCVPAVLPGPYSTGQPGLVEEFAESTISDQQVEGPCPDTLTEPVYHLKVNETCGAQTCESPQLSTLVAGLGWNKLVKTRTLLLFQRAAFLLDLHCLSASQRIRVPKCPGPNPGAVSPARHLL